MNIAWFYYSIQETTLLKALLEEMHSDKPFQSALLSETYVFQVFTGGHGRILWRLQQSVNCK